ncbi:MAG: aspartyl/glutamyl-tRNA amidotransferase subunit C [Methanoregula sp. PtaU1.Bin051]|nr:MAG: aspartyl/glutamyl-tRNA amidotransferase subunit C [Methanoregula sp. PtaU1.Bin051]
MVTEKDVEHIADLADIGMDSGELAPFTQQFNAIIDYFDILDRVKGEESGVRDLYNVMREDDPRPSLPQKDVLSNAPASEDGFIKAPRVM